MGDIYAAVAINTAVSALLFATALWLGRRTTQPVRVALAAGSLALLVLAAAVLRDSVLLARVLPVSNLIVLGNLEFPAAALLAGFAWRSIDPPAGRRVLLLVPLLGVCVYRMVVPLRGEPPGCVDRWGRGGVCMQTSDASCSAAAAATLLARHKIPATEPEMAALCLTRPKGTYMHGVYRGLKKKTDGTPLRVHTFTGGVEGLRARAANGPVLISVGLSRVSGADPVYAERYGWTPGVKHTVVLFGFVGNGRVLIGDPSAGRELWEVQDLQTLYRGEGMQLVPQ